jgi:hypothetical protein
MHWYRLNKIRCKISLVFPIQPWVAPKERIPAIPHDGVCGGPEESHYQRVDVIRYEDFYSVLYYFESRVVWLDLTVENILYYFFIR